MIFNQQLGLLGHLSAACLPGGLVLVFAVIVRSTSVNALAWAIGLLVGSALFGARYRYVWKRIGDQVVRQVRLMAVAPDQPDGELASGPNANEVGN